MNETIIIRKHQFKIETSDTDAALHCRKQLNDTWLNGYINQLHTNFSDLQFSGEDVFIDKIELTLNLANAGVNTADWATIISDGLTRQLAQTTGARRYSERLNNEISTATNPFADAESHQSLKSDAVLTYLQTGNLPSWCRHVKFLPDVWLQEQLNQSKPNAFMGWLLRKLSSEGLVDANSAACKRLIQLGGKQGTLVILQTAFSITNQTPPVLLQPLLNNLANALGISFLDIAAALLPNIIQHRDQWTCASFKQLLLFYNRDKKLSVTTLVTIVNELAQKVQPEDWEREEIMQEALSALKQANSSGQQQKTKSDPAGLSLLPEEGFYTGQAGLVLLHPFLSTLFRETGLLNSSNQFENNENKIQAVRLLAHLSGSNLNDWDLGFEKLLCNLDDTVINQIESQLPGDHKKACDELLQAAIQYWSPLRQSSVEALQETFIRRFGKCTERHGIYLVNIERTGVDILLEDLPWSFNVIKFPWMTNIIEVTW
ncbi:hypothetical protein BH10BAC3_BH10BAC3_08440 [soil metagenome]